MARVVVMLGERIIREIHVGKEPLRIGRDPSNDIHLENPAVSRFHAEIYRQDFPFFVEDKNSTNGVDVNGVKVNWKSGLQDHDRITVGKHTLVFRFDPKDHSEGKLLDMSHAEGTIQISGSKIKK